jgi:flagellar hook-associated protein 1 FlgK
MSSTPFLNALGLLNSLNVGRRALNAQQNALQIVGRNIANVNTPGYTRQKVAIGVPDSQVEVISGERLNRVERVRDELVERLLLQERQHLGSLEKRAALLSQTESAFGEPSDTSLNAQLDRFFGAWTALANTPEPEAARSVVLERGKTLAATFADLGRRLATIQEQNLTDARDLVQNVNSRIEQIRNLNREIANAFNSGSEFLELQDRQDQIIRELAEIVSLRVTEGASGTRTVQIGGLSAVEGPAAGRMEMGAGRNGKITLAITLDGNQFDVQPRGGRLHGLIVAQNELLPAIANDLHRVARTTVEEVNRVHPDFFRPLTTDDQKNRAADFVEVLAQSSGDVKPTATANPGANDIALAVADIRILPVESLGNQSPQQFYQELVGAVGSRVAETTQQRDTAELVVRQLEQRRESISGVSLDEEATDLLIFQRAFQAAARYIQVIDELVETLINRT